MVIGSHGERMLRWISWAIVSIPIAVGGYVSMRTGEWELVTLMLAGFIAACAMCALVASLIMSPLAVLRILFVRRRVK